MLAASTGLASETRHGMEKHGKTSAMMQQDTKTLTPNDLQPRRDGDPAERHGETASANEHISVTHSVANRFS